MYDNKVFKALFGKFIALIDVLRFLYTWRRYTAYMQLQSSVKRFTAHLHQALIDPRVWSYFVTIVAYTPH